MALLLPGDELPEFHGVHGRSSTEEHPARKFPTPPRNHLPSPSPHVGGPKEWRRGQVGLLEEAVVAGAPHVAARPC
jgi:hypothetical protein